MSFQSTIYREQPDGTELPLPVTVAYDYDPAGGDGWNEPRYGETVEIDSVTDAAGNPVETTAEEDDRLTAECLQDAKDAWRSAREP